MRIEKGKGIIRIRGYNPLCLPDDLELEDSDNQILATALSEMEDNKSRKVIVVSRDINMRVKCDALGILTEDYQVEQVVAKSDDLYSGICEVLVDDQCIEDFYNDKPVFLEEKYQEHIFPNQFIMLISNSNAKKTALARYKNSLTELVKVPNITAWETKARNKEQQFALNLLMDPDRDWN